MPATNTAALGITKSGLQPQMAAVLAYVLGWISGLLFVVIEKDNRFVRFHAIQSIGLCVAWVVLRVLAALLPLLGWLLVILLTLGGLILWIICMIKAAQGAWFHVPIVGDIAAKQAGVTQGGT